MFESTGLIANEPSVDLAELAYEISRSEQLARIYKFVVLPVSLLVASVTVTVINLWPPLILPVFCLSYTSLAIEVEDLRDRLSPPRFVRENESYGVRVLATFQLTFSFMVVALCLMLLFTLVALR